VSPNDEDGPEPAGGGDDAPWKDLPAAREAASNLPFDQRPKGTEKIWAAAGLGPNGEPQDARPATPRVMITRLFGKAGRGLNTREAADQLGVQQGTVQGWIRNKKTPSSEAGDRLRQQYADWQNSPDGRKSRIGRKNMKKLKEAKRVSFKALIKISDHERYVSYTLDITDQARMDAVIEQMVTGDDDSLHQATEDLIGNSGFGGSIGLSFGGDDDDIEFE
jgi:transposase